MAIGNRGDEDDDSLLVPLSEDLVRKLDRSRGDESYSEYMDKVLERARERTETDVKTQGTAVVEKAADASTEVEFESYWYSQMQRVFAWLWVGAFVTYVAGDLISTSFVIRTGAGYEANPLIDTLLELNPLLFVGWKLIAVAVLIYLSAKLLETADHTRIPWVAMVVPGFLVIWGAFVTGMNVMNVPDEVRWITSLSIIFAGATIIVGYFLFSMVYEDFVEEHDEYPGLIDSVAGTVYAKLRIGTIKTDETARGLAVDLVFPFLLVASSLIVIGATSNIPEGPFRPGVYADMLLVPAGFVVVATVVSLAISLVDAEWQNLARILARIAAAVGSAVVFVIAALTAYAVGFSDVLGIEGGSPSGLTVTEAAAVVLGVGAVFSVVLISLIAYRVREIKRVEGAKRQYTEQETEIVEDGEAEAERDDEEKETGKRAEARMDGGEDE